MEQTFSKRPQPYSQSERYLPSIKKTSKLVKSQVQIQNLDSTSSESLHDMLNLKNISSTFCADIDYSDKMVESYYESTDSVLGAGVTLGSLVSDSDLIQFLDTVDVELPE